jgi:putative transposase
MSTGKRKTTEEKVAILQEAETLGAVETIRKHGISYQTYYTWKAKHASGGADSLKPNGIVAATELKRLQKENARLKELVAEKELHIKIQNELLKKK